MKVVSPAPKYNVVALQVFLVTTLLPYLVLLPYDLYLYLRGGRQNTISHAVYVYGGLHPWFAWGLVGFWAAVVVFLGLHFYGP